MNADQSPGPQYVVHLKHVPPEGEMGRFMCCVRCGENAYQRSIRPRLLCTEESKTDG